MPRVLLATALAASASASAALRGGDGAADRWLSVPPALYQLIATQANATLAQVGGGNAYPTQGAQGKDGVWRWQTDAGYGNWVGAFQGGILWKLANYSAAAGDAAAAEWWQAAGNARGAYMAANQFNTGTHDVGFMLLPLFLQQYQQTGNTSARDILINGAHSLAQRFSKVVGCFESWGPINPPNHQFEVIIDNMLNTELPLWVAQETGNATLRDMVLSHADRMISDVYQPFNPGCVWHLVTYDDRTGAILNRSSTPQGLGLNTVWSRGQGWATYGYAMAYRYTQKAAYLQTAASSADCFIRLTGLCCAADAIPLWDFNATGACGGWRASGTMGAPVLGVCA
jgi:unsaturated chondroitin disaccharide hydrolase